MNPLRMQGLLRQMPRLELSLRQRQPQKPRTQAATDLAAGPSHRTPMLLAVRTPTLPPAPHYIYVRTTASWANSTAWPQPAPHEQQSLQKQQVVRRLGGSKEEGVSSRQGHGQWECALPLEVQQETQKVPAYVGLSKRRTQCIRRFWFHSMIPNPRVARSKTP